MFVMGDSHQLGPDELFPGDELDLVGVADQCGGDHDGEVLVIVDPLIAGHVLAFEVGVDRHL